MHLAENGTKLNIFSASALKLLACGFMLIDHVGMRLFPKLLLLRIIGRLAFPIFAFFIAEGCRYTRNKTRHFFSVFLLGLLCEAVYIIYMGGWYGNILLTFSVSILLIYLLQYCRQSKAPYIAYTVFALILLALAYVTRYVNFDYYFTGIIAPLFAAWPGDRSGDNPDTYPRPLSRKTQLILFSFGIMLTALQSPMAWVQLFALLSIPLLAMYNGKGGRHKLKHFFYIFYPTHLLLIELANVLIK